MREIKEEAKDIVYMDEINHECTLACPPGPIYVVWLQQSIVTNHILQTAFIHVFLYSCIWIGKLFISHIFGTNLTYCHWFEHNGEYFLNFLRRFSGFWKPICQRPSWISWSFRNNLSMEYTMYIIHARKYTVMICEVTTGGKDLKLTKGEFFKQSTILNIFYIHIFFLVLKKLVPVQRYHLCLSIGKYHLRRGRKQDCPKVLVNIESILSEYILKMWGTEWLELLWQKSFVNIIIFQKSNPPFLLQTHVEPLSSRVDGDGGRQEVERGFELPPAIYQVPLLLSYLKIFFFLVDIANIES